MLENRGAEHHVVRKSRHGYHQFPGATRPAHPRRVYQGVRVRNTVKELLAAVREEGGHLGRAPGGHPKAHTAATRPPHRHVAQDALNHCADFRDLPTPPAAHCPHHPHHPHHQPHHPHHQPHHAHHPGGGAATAEGALYGTPPCPGGTPGLTPTHYADCLPPEIAFQYCEQPAAYIGEFGLLESAGPPYGLSQFPAFHSANLDHLQGLDNNHHHHHHNSHHNHHHHLTHNLHSLHQEGPINSGTTYTARVFEAPLYSASARGVGLGGPPYAGFEGFLSGGGPSSYSPQGEVHDGLLDLSVGHMDAGRETLPEGYIFGAISTGYGFTEVEGQSSPDLPGDSAEEEWILGSTGTQQQPPPPPPPHPPPH
ncbi:uncharacterized protein LOC144737171 isoform X2 [Lampetra planeri]